MCDRRRSILIPLRLRASSGLLHYLRFQRCSLHQSQSLSILDLFMCCGIYRSSTNQSNGFGRFQAGILDLVFLVNAETTNLFFPPLDQHCLLSLHVDFPVDCWWLSFVVVSSFSGLERIFEDFVQSFVHASARLDGNSFLLKQQSCSGAVHGFRILQEEMVCSTDF